MDQAQQIRETLTHLFQGKLSYDTFCGFQIHRDFSSVFYDHELAISISRLNPSLTRDDIESCINQLKRKKEPLIHSLKTGLNYKGKIVRFIDFNQVNENSFMAVSHFTMGKKERRPDLMIFINGIPLAVIVFPWDEQHDHQWAFDELQRLKDDIPTLFKYNPIAVLTSHSNTKVGLSQSPQVGFTTWNSNSSKHEQFYEIFFEKRRFLQLIRSFIPYVNMREMSMADYIHFLIVRSAVQSAEKNKKGGLFYRPVHKGQAPFLLFFQSCWNNPTDTMILITPFSHIITDLCKKYSLFLEKEPIYPRDPYELQEILENEPQKYIILLHPDTAKECPESLCLKNSLIVLFDGVYHRDSDDFDEVDCIPYDVLAISKTALPNATFVGYTGTALTSEINHPILGLYHNPEEEQSRIRNMRITEEQAPTPQPAIVPTPVQSTFPQKTAVKSHEKVKQVMDECKALLLNNKFEETFLFADLSQSVAAIEFGAKFLFLIEEQQKGFPLEKRSIYLFKKCGEILEEYMPHCSHYLRGQERLRAEYYKGVYECLLDFEEMGDIDALLNEEFFQKQLQYYHLSHEFDETT